MGAGGRRAGGRAPRGKAALVHRPAGRASQYVANMWPPRRPTRRMFALRMLFTHPRQLQEGSKRMAKGCAAQAGQQAGRWCAAAHAASTSAAEPAAFAGPGSQAHSS